MTNSIRIETPRLILRPPERADYEPWCAFMADAEAMRYIGGEAPRAVTWRSFCGMAGAWSLFGFSMFSVIEKNSGRWIGRLGPWQPEGWPGTEIAWGIAREAWGKGLAAEGAAAATDWAVGTLGWTEIIHTIHPENARSQKLARRMGSRLLRQAVLPPPINASADVWGQSAEEWQRNRAAFFPS